jgi:hypothetical protein
MAEAAAAELARREAARVAAIAAEAEAQRMQAAVLAADAAAAAAAAEAAAVLQGDVAARLRHTADMAAETVQHALSALLFETLFAETEEPLRARKSVAPRAAPRSVGSPSAPASACTSSAAPSCAPSPAGSALALPATMPMPAHQRRRRPRERVPCERIWATALALSVMEELDSCWLVDAEDADDSDEDDAPMRTIVDAGREFLEAQARADRRVKKLLKSGALAAAAKKARRDWKAIQNHNVSALREADVINRFTALMHIQRASARVVRSMMTDHGTFATFLDTDGYIMRWQRFMILVTLVLSTLLTSIWFYCAFPPARLSRDAPGTAGQAHRTHACFS